ncbi:hypothetical protein [Pararhodobacter aggregans]|uniref:Uncharacterized protein n=1 Tax=Pararhodobacter aggregans TaxID=404875 RepID=A0A2T7UXT2_9RHOB|nr:hypothetical protein [Pararhodobacter aggregans]PTX05193.1 hypothetical protein C8N33_101609 [Pararhodobacter aggregans]PVE49492.1 hypothetical protein DDE23_03595 [Pararhodobacter aggregans]
MVETVAALIADAERLTTHHRPDAAATRLRRALAFDGPSLEDRARLNLALARSLWALRDGEAALDAVCAAMVIDLPEVLPDLAAVLGQMPAPSVQGALRLVRARAMAGLSGAPLAGVLAVSGQHLLALATTCDHGSTRPDRAREQALAGEAFADLTAALAFPQPEAVHAARAEACARSGAHREAAALWQRVGQEFGLPVAFARQSNALMALEDWVGAARAYAWYEAGGAEPLWSAGAARAEALLDEGRAAEAIAPARMALKASRDRQDARFAALAGGALGRALAATGQGAAARRVLREALPLLREEWGEGIAQVAAAEAALSALG